MKNTSISALQQLLNEKGVFEALGVNRIGIFGSFARGESYNDIDLLLDEEPGYQKRETLQQIIESEWKIPCDVLVREYTEPIILHYINKDLKYIERK